LSVGHSDKKEMHAISQRLLRIGRKRGPHSVIGSNQPRLVMPLLIGPQPCLPPALLVN